MNNSFQTCAGLLLFRGCAENNFCQCAADYCSRGIENRIAKLFAKLLFDTWVRENAMAGFVAVDNNNVATGRQPGGHAAFSGTNSSNQSDHRNDLAVRHKSAARICVWKPW